jgi:DNA-binding response OmpR family regulator
MQTILVVDDETGLLHILEVVLGRAGYRVLTAETGSEGYHKVCTTRPDLVLLDDMLPGISGTEICVKVKNDPALNEIPVIMCSAGPRVRDPNYIRETGANAVLLKPFKPTDVLKKINEFLGGVGV